MLRAGRFSRNRKLVKTHQNVCVFYKGNPKEIQNNFGEITAIGGEDADY